MANTYQPPSDDDMESKAGQPSVSSPPQSRMLPPQLWNLPYITHSPETLDAAISIDPERVSRLFGEQKQPPQIASNISAREMQHPPPFQPLPLYRASAPPITAYDGQPSTLRSFCSQLINQIKSQPDQFPSEKAKVYFAYQCLGPGAVSKMRSSFRCLEDQSVPEEITTLAQFISALKQRCQDPAREDQATQVVESLYQRNMKFHDFITIFEDNMADSAYSEFDKTHWKKMLHRRLSRELRTLLNAASDAPAEYHAFVNYLRAKDAVNQSIKTSPGVPSSHAPHRPPFVTATPTPSTAPRILPFPTPLSGPSTLTVSQGGSAMDLDLVSRQKLPNGRLTQQAKDARRTLGRCVRCNKLGHSTNNCSPEFRSIDLAAPEEAEFQGEDLKEQLQQ